MKKTILTIALILSSFLMVSVSAQTNSLSQLEDQDNVTVVTVNKKAFEMMAKVAPEDMDQESREMVDIISNLSELKVYTTEDSNISKDMDNIVSNYIKNSNLSELMKVNDKEAKVKIYVQEKGDHITELLMFVNEISSDNKSGRNPESVVLSIKGDIDLNNISKFISQMNVSGGENIKIEKN